MNYNTIHELLNFKSFKSAEVVSGKGGLDNTFTGIEILEAPDIENWAEPGYLLLTSFYTLRNFTELEIKDFFYKAKNIGISAIIVKINRFIDAIPEHVKAVSDLVDIPVIQVNKNVLYQSITLEIFQNIISRNSYLLAYFYDIYSQFVNRRGENLTVEDILHILEGYVRYPVTLMENFNTIHYTTDPAYSDFNIISTSAVESLEFMNFKLQRFTVKYDNESSIKEIIGIKIPTYGFVDHIVYIHVPLEMLTDENIVAMELSISNLQTELLKRHIIKNADQSRQNEFISDILYQRMTYSEQNSENFEEMNLFEDQQYYVAVINFTRKNQEESSYENLYMNYLIDFCQQNLGEVNYFIGHASLTLIIPAERFKPYELEQKLLKIVETATQRNKRIFSEMSVNVSSKAAVYDIHKAFVQAKDTYRLLSQVNQLQRVNYFDRLGIYRYIISADRAEMYHKIPEVVKTIHRDNVDLFETLDSFLQNNQNFKETADQIFVHPKTVKYRIDKLREEFNLAFEDSKQMLDINIGIQLLKLYKVDDVKEKAV